MIQEVDQVAAPADVSAERADGLRKRPHQDGDAPVQIEMVDRPAPVAAKHTR